MVGDIERNRHLAFLPWDFCYSRCQLLLNRGLLSIDSTTSFRGLNSSRTPVNMQRSAVWFAPLHRASNGYQGASQVIWLCCPPNREIISAAPNADHPPLKQGQAQQAAKAVPSSSVKISSSKWVALGKA